MKVLCLALELLCGCVGLAISRFQVGPTGAKHASFERFDGSCPGHKVPIIYELQGVRTEGSTLFVNSTLSVKEDILTDPNMMLVIERCKSKENLDTCEHFHNYKTTKYCAMLQSGSSLWGGFFKSFNPEFKCPFKKGPYRGVDSMIDMSAFLLLTGDDWCWKVQVEVHEKRTNRMLMCTFIEAVIGSGPQNKTNSKG